MGNIPYSVYLRKKRANVLRSQRLCMGLSVMLAKVRRTRKVDDPKDEFFYRFEDMPQPKYGIRKEELNEMTCNIVKFQMDDEDDPGKKNSLASVLAELKSIFGIGDDKVK